jgi:hypothetical protein
MHTNTRFLNAITALKVRLYGLLHGTWPYPWAFIRINIFFLKPKRFHRKIQYKMARDRRPLLRTLADKFLVREFVTSKIGERYLPQLLWVSEEAAAFPTHLLPENFVVKTTHGSGGVVVVWEGSPRHLGRHFTVKTWWSQTLIHPSELDWDDLGKLMQRLLVDSFYYKPYKLPEWAYRNPSPKVIIEELLVGEDGGLPLDYKFFMIEGECAFIYLTSDRFGDIRRDFFDKAWNHLPLQMKDSTSDSMSRLPSRPSLLDEMVEVAEKLSSGIDFIRVDLYLTKEGIKVGELTNYPDGGLGKLRPKDLSLRLTSRWKPWEHY